MLNTDVESKLISVYRLALKQLDGVTSQWECVCVCVCFAICSTWRWYASEI